MRSEKQIAASRANGARSRGPKTPEGKARSARNATRHGLLAHVIVLEEEPEEAFKQLCREYAARFGPLDAVENGMVEEMVASFWRMRRIWAIENRYLDTAMANQDGPSALDRLMTAWSDLDNEHRLTRLHRYETRLHMTFQRAFRNLVAVRKLPPVPGAPYQTNLATPTPSTNSNPPEPEPNPRPSQANPPDPGQPGRPEPQTGHAVSRSAILTADPLESLVGGLRELGAAASTTR